MPGGRDLSVGYDRQMTPLPVPITRVTALDLPLPAYYSAGAAGLDLSAAVESPLVIEPGRVALVPCGIAIAIPPGYEGQVRPRSGLASRHGITVLNAPGTIDCDYRGELKALMINHGTEPFTVTAGMRVAQLVIAPVMRIEWELCTSLPETLRASGGFGHTG
jgi:dUTP pyrophosphatase